MVNLEMMYCSYKSVSTSSKNEKRGGVRGKA